MAWPPTIYPPDRNNDTENINRHPGDHNQLSQAVTEIVTKVNANTTAIATKLNLAGGTVTGEFRLSGAGDVSLASTAHPFQIGLSNGPNVAFDSNEIQSRNNGAAANLAINSLGGQVNASGVSLSGGNITCNGVNAAGNRIRLYEDGSALFQQGASGEDFHATTDLIADRHVFGREQIVSGPTNGAGWDANGSRLMPEGGIRSICGSSHAGTANLVLDRHSTADDVGEDYVSFWRAILGGGSATKIGGIRIASQTSVAYLQTSDGRLKVQTNNAADATDVVSYLGSKVYRGRWIADGDQGEEWYFLNSQDAEPKVAFAVSGPPDGDTQTDPQQLDHSAMVPLLLAAVSQLSARVAELEARNV